MLTCIYRYFKSICCLSAELHDEMDGKEFVVEFDFLGKDSVRYYNKIPVEKQVFKDLHLFMKGKEPGDDLFDRLTVSGGGPGGLHACPVTVTPTPSSSTP